MYAVPVGFIESCFEREFILYDILMYDMEKLGYFSHVMYG